MIGTEKKYVFPLSASDLAEVISCRDERTIRVDYSASKIKKIPFVHYAANLKLTISVDLTTMSTEEQVELLSVYVRINSLLFCSELNRLLQYILLVTMDYDKWHEVDDIKVEGVGEDFIELAQKELGEELNMLFLFCSSLTVYTSFVQKEGGSISDLEFHETYENVIDDPMAVGANVVWLLKLPDFLPFFFSTYEQDDYPKALFTHQFEDFLFNGRSLFDFFLGNRENPNWLLVISSAALSNDGVLPRSDVHEEE